MKNNDIQKKGSDHKISRKEALKKAGALALTAATMMVLLPAPAKARESVPDRMPQHGRPGTRPDHGR